jgi:hypothetical protein
MVIGKAFDLRPQHSLPWFVPIEVLHEVATSIPDTTRVRVDGCEDIEQVLNVHILRPDPLRFLNPGLPGSRINRQPGEVMILGRTEEWR